jgi:hypothetical protein
MRAAHKTDSVKAPPCTWQRLTLSHSRQGRPVAGANTNTGERHGSELMAKAKRGLERKPKPPYPVEARLASGRASVSPVRDKGPQSHSSSQEGHGSKLIAKRRSRLERRPRIPFTL